MQLFCKFVTFFCNQDLHFSCKYPCANKPFVLVDTLCQLAVAKKESKMYDFTAWCTNYFRPQKSFFFITFGVSQKNGEISPCHLWLFCPNCGCLETSVNSPKMGIFWRHLWREWRQKWRQKCQTFLHAENDDRKTNESRLLLIADFVRRRWQKNSQKKRNCSSFKDGATKNLSEFWDRNFEKK